MATVNVKIEGNSIMVKSPYDKTFISEIKRLGGKWDAPYWVVDIRQEERVKEILRDVYGEDGAVTSSEDEDMVDLKLTGCAWDNAEAVNEMRLGNRLIAARRMRDAAVYFGNEVTCIAGKFKASGGSSKYPLVAPEDPDALVFEVYNVSRNLYNKVKDREGVSLLSDTNPSKTEKEKLLEEKAKLLVRLKEIESELAKITE